MPRIPRRSHYIACCQITNSPPIDPLQRSNILRNLKSLLCIFTNNFYLDPIVLGSIIYHPSNLILANWWPLINASRIASYFAVAASVGVMYDWALTLGQEVELIWVRYVGLGCVVYVWKFQPLMSRSLPISSQSGSHTVDLPTISISDAGCIIIYNTMILAIVMMQISEVEHILAGTYQCMINYAGDFILMSSMLSILGIVWEVLTLCLAVWIAVKHFRELRQHSTSGIIGDCFTVLMKTHFGLFSPTLSTDLYSMDTQIYLGITEIFQIVQISVLGPRLILGVREYHAKLVASSDAATAMTSIALRSASLKPRAGIRKDASSHVAPSLTSFASIVSYARMLGKFWGKGFSAEDKEDLRKRWDSLGNELVANIANLPLALHWSLESGIFTNDIWVTIFSLINGIATFRGGWRATSLPSVKAVESPNALNTADTVDKTKH
ncbi:hypothetical protein BD769DRAFT_1388957 [Suillus cothurnatus]|nr:hypothetical protein BD769DRAFT_1388957 [Suillus cothurnatus]